MKFTLPGATPAPEELPADLAALRAESIENFARELGGLAAIAKMNGWFDKYATEIQRVILAAYRKGRADAANK
jgi:hypothetical protein